MRAADQNTSTLTPLYDGLDRLVAGNPQRVPAGSKITLTTVALEAGRSPGSIKASRSVYAALRAEIDDQAKKQLEKAKPGSLDVAGAKIKAAKAKASSVEFETKYKESLGRELMMLVQIEQLEDRIRKIDNVVPIKNR